MWFSLKYLSPGTFVSSHDFDMSKAQKEASKVNLCILYISFQMALLSDGYSFCV